ncbi:MAG: DNA lyase [Ignavibacteria bacterium]|nr:DNA lyase [Ignavibacteria bacterium]
MRSADRNELLALHAESAEKIRTRLSEFRRVPPSRHFYELCFCLMTPQSSAAQCALVAAELERRRFQRAPFDPEQLLRAFEGGYVRFHRTKARRLLAARESFPDVADLLTSDEHEKDIREALVARINGLGYKEASHFLRNIGKTRVTIIDRHIIRNFIRLDLLDAWPASISRARYLALEALFEDTAAALGMPPDELDLLLWSRETGFILK